MTIAQKIAAATAGLTYIKEWVLNAERGCIQVVEKWRDEKSGEEHTITHDYLDDNPPPVEAEPEPAEPGPNDVTVGLIGVKADATAASLG